MAHARDETASVAEPSFDGNALDSAHHAPSHFELSQQIMVTRDQLLALAPSVRCMGTCCWLAHVERPPVHRVSVRRSGA
jgi:hypothetical protein